MHETIRMGGIELRFLEDRGGTGGGLDLFEMTLQPNARMPVPHYHDHWDEAVYGLGGVSTWRIGEGAVELQPGQSIFIRRGIVHGFDNRSDAPAKCLCILTPGALGPQYFREMAGLLEGGRPDPEALKAVMLRYGLIPVPG